jgi:hypothetical protein
LLVARAPFACALKRQPFSIVAEIRFGILAAECNLGDRTKMTLTG